MRSHTVILGAGATIAAIPDGDKNGKSSSVMNGLLKKTKFRRNSCWC
jgi:hypothetical protein